jgi:hypothetical protein
MNGEVGIEPLAVPDATFTQVWNTYKFQSGSKNWPGDDALVYTIFQVAQAYGSAKGAMPAPAISSLVPATGPHATAFTLTVNGTGFSINAAGKLNAVAKTTTFVNSTTLQITVAATDIAAAGAVPITVTNGDGQTSAAVNFTAT